MEEEGYDIVHGAELSDDEGGEEDEHDIAAVAAAAAADLLTLGVAVVRAFDEADRAHWNRRLFDAMDAFPEYRAKGREVQRVLGGFGALGNPSSFHHPEVRVFRRMRKKLVFRPLMAGWAKLAFPSAEAHRSVLLESLFDRLCVRCEAFNRPVAEAWHRDIYGAEQFQLRPLPHSLPDGHQDVLFGGWTNLDDREQRFVGLVATHVEGTSGRAGFAEFTKDEIKSFRFGERLVGQASRSFGATVRTDEKGHIRVPPGCAVVFQQQLIHSVVSGPQPATPALRVFHGLRLTREASPLFDIAAAVENGGVPRIPSGQVPPMFSANHYQFFASHERYRAWGERTFKRTCLFERTTKTGTPYCTPGSPGNRNRAANTGRSMPSLAELGLWDERFRYSGWERRALFPQRLFGP